MTAIATVAANSVLTSTKVNEIIGGINAIGSLQATKTLDESVISNTTLQDDDELLVAVAAASIYDLTLDLYYTSGVTPDLKFGWTYPAGTTIKASMQGYFSGVMQSVLISQTGVNSLDGGTDFACVVRGRIFTSSTAGTLRLQWAQVTSNATNTTVLAGSALTLTKLL